MTPEDYRGLSGLLSESLVQPSPLSKNCTHPEWAKELAKSLWTPHTQHTPSLNCCCLVDATELWAPERQGTETVSSLRQSISWTLDNKRGTHNTIIHYLFITHTYFIFKFARHTCTYIIVYIIYIVFFLFCTLPICILFFIIGVLSCPVAVILLHCGASVTIANSSYV